MVKEMLLERKQEKLAKEADVTLKQVQHHWNTIKHYPDQGKINYLKGMVKREKKVKATKLPAGFQRTIDELLEKDFIYTFEKLEKVVENRPKVDRLEDARPMLWAVKTIGDPERARRAFNAVMELMED